MSMRLLRMMLALVAVAVLGAGSVRAATAQEGEDEVDFAQLEGIEQVVGRSYTIDFMALMSSPEAAEGDIAYPTGIVTAYAVVAKFDEDDNAEAGWETLLSSFNDQAEADADEAATEITELEVDDIGDNAAGIAKRALELNHVAALDKMPDLGSLAKLVLENLRAALDSFVTRDADRAAAIIAADREIDKRNASLFAECLAHVATDHRCPFGEAHLVQVATQSRKRARVLFDEHRRGCPA